MVVPLNEFDFLKRALAVYGNKEAVVCGRHRFTYNQFGERVNRWANAMLRLGVEKGDRVAILSQNCHRMMETFFSAPLIGAISMPMNFRLLPSDFEYILNHGGAKALIVEAGFEHLIEPIRSELRTVEHFIVASDEGDASDSWRDYETLIAESSPQSPAPATVDENETSALLYTSGTTGKPKGVMLTHRNLYLNALNTVIEFGLRDSDAFMQITAQFHCNGWGFPYAVTGVGGKYVALKKFDPQTLFDLIPREGVTVCCLAPTMISMVLNHPTCASVNLPRNLRVGTAGSAPPMALIQALQERFGWEVIQVYGLTETSPFLTVSKIKPHMSDWDASEKYRVQTKSGYPMLGVDLRVVDADGSDVTADGKQAGEVITRSNVVMAGYWNQPDATNAAIVDRWFRTGDVATLDDEGYIEVVDRAKDLIISGGENISSIEVEGVLYQHPAVLEAAVVAVPDDTWGEAPKALVVLKQGATVSEADFIAFCRERLAHFKCPKSVEFIDALPRTATGKVQKSVLRERYWQGRAKRV